MTPNDYDHLRRLLKDRSGLVLSGDKQYLVESRLLPLARKAGFAGLSELVANLHGPHPEALTVEVVEAMTTNESFFFRDKTPFEYFRDVIMPALLAARAAQRRIRIWCAAASTGQEPYSLAICLKEMSHAIAGWRIDIIATDLSTEVLEKAKSGIYSQFEVQRGLPITMLIKYFTKVGECWQIVGAVRPGLHNDECRAVDVFDVPVLFRLLDPGPAEVVLQLLDPALGLAQLPPELRHPRRDLVGWHAQATSQLGQQAQAALDQLQGGGAGGEVEPAQAGADARLGEDHNGRGLGAVANVGASAELAGPVARADDADDVPVLLVEQVHGAGLDGLGVGLLLSLEGQ